MENLLFEISRNLKASNFEETVEKLNKIENKSEFYQVLPAILLNLPFKTELICKLFIFNAFDSSKLIEILSTSLKIGKINNDVEQIFVVLRAFYYLDSVKYINSNIKEIFESISLGKNFFKTFHLNISNSLENFVISFDENFLQSLRLKISFKFDSDDEFVLDFIKNKINHCEESQFNEIVNYFDSDQLLCKSLISCKDLTFSIKILLKFLSSEEKILSCLSIFKTIKMQEHFIYTENLNSLLTIIWLNFVSYSENPEINDKFSKLVDENLTEKILRVSSGKVYLKRFDIEMKHSDYKVLHVENDLLKLVKIKDFDKIDQMPREIFLKEFFEIAEPSISHFLRYAEILKKYLILDEDEQEFFVREIQRLSVGRSVYKEVILAKMKKFSILK